MRSEVEFRLQRMSPVLPLLNLALVIQFSSSSLSSSLAIFLLVVILTSRLPTLREELLFLG
jgi:hypothetical protein